MTRPILFFVRHGETDWNAEGRLQGQRDIPLNDVGREQAAMAGRMLARLTPDSAALPWLVSPLSRTQETAQLARTALSLEPKTYVLDPRLKELTFGAWEGLTWPELRQRDPRGANSRSADKWGFAPPKGESYAMLAERIAPWLESVTQTSIIVSHGGVARVLFTLIAGMAPLEAAEQDIHQGRVLVFEAGSARWA